MRRRTRAATAVLAALTVWTLARAGTAIAQERGPLAHVVSVAVEGKPGKYKFDVGVSSADTGCGLYADDQVGAASSTGWGEGIIRVVLAHRAVSIPIVFDEGIRTGSEGVD